MEWREDCEVAKGIEPGLRTEGEFLLTHYDFQALSGDSNNNRPFSHESSECHQSKSAASLFPGGSKSKI